MKKVLSFVLVLAMILGCTAMAFATVATEKAVAVFEDAPNSEVAAVLKDLGVLTGDENGKANLADPITRAEVCTVLMKVLGYGKVGKTPVNTQFVDVTKAHWASGYINYANTLGMVDGRDAKAKLFEPDEHVTGFEAVAFVMKALGYAAEHLDGVWPSNFVVQAGIDTVLGDFNPTDEDATREEVFTLLFNALDVPTVKWSKLTEGYESQTKTFAKCLGLATKASELYTTTDEAIKLDTKYDNGFDPAPYVGSFATVLSKGEEKVTIVKVVSTKLVGEFTSAGKFKTAEKTYAVTAATEGAMKLANGVSDGAIDAFSGKGTIQAKLSKDGKTITDIYSVDSAVSEKYVVSKETVKQIAALYTNKVKKSTVEFLNTTLEVTKSGIYYVPVEASFVVEGDADNLKDIAANDVIEVFDGDTPKVVVTRNTVEDVVITNIKGANYTFDNGVTYKFATKTDATTLTPVATDIASENAFTLYLDQDGKIFKSEKYLGGEKALTYAFVLDTYEDETSSGWSSDTAKGVKKVQLFNFDGEVVTYEFNLKKCEPLTTAGFTAGAIVTYHVTDDKIDVFALAALTTNVAVKVGTNYATIGTTSHHYASDIEVVMIAKDSADVKISDAEHYAVKTVKDLAGKTWKADYTSYLLNASDEVSKLVVKENQTADAKVTITTMYGFAMDVKGTDSKGEYVTVLGPEVDEDVYLAKGSTATVEANKFYKFILEDGKISTAAVLNSGDEVIKATTAAVALAPEVDLDDDLIKVDGKQAGLADDYVIFTWNATAKAYEEAGEIEDLYSACEITLLNTKSDKNGLTGLVDVIILKLYEE